MHPQLGPTKDAVGLILQELAERLANLVAGEGKVLAEYSTSD